MMTQETLLVGAFPLQKRKKERKKERREKLGFRKLRKTLPRKGRSSSHRRRVWTLLRCSFVRLYRKARFHSHVFLFTPIIIAMIILFARIVHTMMMMLMMSKFFFSLFLPKNLKFCSSFFCSFETPPPPPPEEEEEEEEENVQHQSQPTVSHHV